MKKMICVEKCFHNDTLYVVGQVVNEASVKDSPYFKEEKEGKQFIEDVETDKVDSLTPGGRKRTRKPVAPVKVGIGAQGKESKAKKGKDKDGFFS